MPNYQWLTPKQIAEMADMPDSIQGVHKKAQREGWQKRKHEGVRGPGVEYYISVPDKNAVNAESGRYQLPNIKDVWDEFALIPGYSIQVSAGHGSQAFDNYEPSRYLAFRKKWLKFRRFEAKDLVIVWAKGDSMEPTIHNNDTLVIHQGRKKLVDGKIFVIRFDETLWVKRIQVMPHSWLLISDNKELYPPIEIKHADHSTFEVVGEVVHIAKDIGD